MKARRYVISGTVQGVNFRSFTRDEACRLGLKGWVMNLPDGRVACMAEGSEEALKNFERFLGEGPPSARVEKIQSQDMAPGEAPDGFEVRFYPAKKP